MLFELIYEVWYLFGNASIYVFVLMELPILIDSTSWILLSEWLYIVWSGFALFAMPFKIDTKLTRIWVITTVYSKTCVKQPLSKRLKIGFKAIIA